MTNKKCAIYSRVSTDSQTTENQTRELRVYAARMNYQIVAELSDNGISGSKGKKDRPGYARLCEMICRKEIDIVLRAGPGNLHRAISGVSA